MITERFFQAPIVFQGPYSDFDGAEDYCRAKMKGPPTTSQIPSPRPAIPRSRAPLYTLYTLYPIPIPFTYIKGNYRWVGI